MGTPAGSASSTSVIPDPNAPLTIGQAEGLAFMPGLLDELTIYGRELATIVTAGRSGKCKPYPYSTRILPQFAFGGGWYSALYFANIGSSAVSIPIDFISDSGNPMVVPSAGGSRVTLSLPPRGTATIEAPNMGSFTQGYANSTTTSAPAILGCVKLSIKLVQDFAWHLRSATRLAGRCG